MPEISKRLLEFFNPYEQEEAVREADEGRLRLLEEYHRFDTKCPDLFNWICDQADAHVDIDQNLLEKTARCNTFKEVRNRITRFVREAKRDLGE